MRKLFSLALLSAPVAAHCPVCVAAAGAGAAAVSYAGLDGGVVGVFLGGFGFASGEWLARKWTSNLLWRTLAGAASSLLTVLPASLAITQSVVPLVVPNLVGGTSNEVYWLNSALVGGFAGLISSALAVVIHEHIKSVHGKVLFPFQSVTVHLLALIVTGLAFYWLGGKA